MPSIVRPVGTTASDLAAAFRHESCGGDVGSTDERKVVPQIGRHDHAPLVAPPTESAEIGEPAGREPWFTAFVDLLAYHGADKTVTVAAVDRLADLFAASVLDVLPEPVRDHPSIVPSAIARRVRTLDQRGWQRPQVRDRLAGIETADKPGAAVLTRLDNLAALSPPRPSQARPQCAGNATNEHGCVS